MIERIFDRERRDVSPLAVESAAESFRLVQGLSGLHRHARDQWLRAAQSIPLNIAEGNRNGSPNNPAGFFDIARGSALKCAAVDYEHEHEEEPEPADATESPIRSPLVGSPIAAAG